MTTRIDRRLRQVVADLWETTTDSPFPGLTTHAYLWRRDGAPNILFYSVATDNDLGELAELGGVGHQYLSHRDEAGPTLRASLDVLAGVRPDLVVSSAFGDGGAHRVDAARWMRLLAEVRMNLAHGSRS